MRQLDERREKAHLTKAELARRAGMPEETGIGTHAQASVAHFSTLRGLA
jgi:transcriptional regulator with XRE-family HTH domain